MNRQALILIIVLLLVFGVGGAPAWGFHSYGWGPSFGIGGILVILLVLWLLGII